MVRARVDVGFVREECPVARDGLTTPCIRRVCLPERSTGRYRVLVEVGQADDYPEGLHNERNEEDQGC